MWCTSVINLFYFFKVSEVLIRIFQHRRHSLCVILRSSSLCNNFESHWSFFALLPQVHPAPQKLWSDCIFSGEKGIYSLPFLCVFFWVINSSQEMIENNLFHVSDGGGVCAVLLPDQKE